MAIISGADLGAVYTAAQLEEGKTPALGDCFYGSGNKVYKFVVYETGVGDVAAVTGNVSYYHGINGYRDSMVTSDVSNGIDLGAGVLQSAPADGEYCWIQTKGFASLTTALTAGSDGDPLTPTGAGDGTLDVSATVTDHICAFACDASDNEIICDFPW